MACCPWASPRTGGPPRRCGQGAAPLLLLPRLPCLSPPSPPTVALLLSRTSCACVTSLRVASRGGFAPRRKPLRLPPGHTSDQLRKPDLTGGKNRVWFDAS